MKQLFNAIEKLFPGYKILDVRFSMLNTLDVIDIDSLDYELANAISNAGEPITSPEELEKYLWG